TDDDNDGIPDDADNNPKGKDDLTVTLSPANGTPVVEGQLIAPRPAVVVNKPNAVITGTQTNGITVDGTGNLTGTPVITDWTPGENDRIVNVPVKVVVETPAGQETKDILVPVTVQRDTDKDGQPDKDDTDDDNDGIPDDQDTNPKATDKLTAPVKAPTKPAVVGQPVEAGQIVVTPNKPGTTITSTPTDGLSVDPTGQLVGTPTTTFDGDDEEKTVNVPVRVEKDGDEPVVTTVPVTVLRDTDGDGTPDKTDTDDDNDGIPDAQDKNPKMADALREDYVIIVSVDGTEQTATYEDITHEQ
ncbi:hypothetical protein ACMZ6Z_09460, partial [Streptococcus pluranimalium]